MFLNLIQTAGRLRSGRMGGLNRSGFVVAGGGRNTNLGDLFAGVVRGDSNREH